MDNYHRELTAIIGMILAWVLISLAAVDIVIGTETLWTSVEIYVAMALAIMSFIAMSHKL